MIRFACLVIFLFSLSHVASATESCDNKRLDLNDGPLTHVPIYNQEKFNKDVNICWAITAAQLIDAHRAKTESPLRNITSPLSIALNRYASHQHEDFTTLGEESYAAQKRVNFKSDGKIRDAAENLVAGDEVQKGLSEIRGREVCDQNFLDRFIDMKNAKTDDDRANYDSGVKLSVHDYFYTVLSGMDLRRRGVLITDEIKRKISDHLDGRKGCRSELFKNLDAINTALQAGIDADPQIKFAAANVGAFTSQLCSKNKFAVNFSNPGHLENTPERATFAQETINQIANLLDRNTPIGISLQSCLLEGPNSCKKNNTTGLHAMVVAGRRWDGKTCQYFLRNSYGENCEKIKSKWPCERGGLWVESASLSSRTNTLDWID